MNGYDIFQSITKCAEKEEEQTLTDSEKEDNRNLNQIDESKNE